MYRSTAYSTPGEIQITQVLPPVELDGYAMSGFSLMCVDSADVATVITMARCNLSLPNRAVTL